MKQRFNFFFKLPNLQYLILGKSFTFICLATNWESKDEYFSHAKVI